MRVAYIVCSNNCLHSIHSLYNFWPTELLCPELTPPENGNVFVNGQTVNSVATYFCDDGFTPQLLVRSCLDNGEWSGFDPLCLSMCSNKKNLDVLKKYLCQFLSLLGDECDPNELSNPMNGMVTFDSVTLGSVATYTCDQPSYRLVGSSTRICERNGANAVWSGQEPTCQRKNESLP